MGINPNTPPNPTARLEALYPGRKVIMKDKEATICFCGSPMIKKGYGKYPYPCPAQDKHPQAMIYEGCKAGHTGWTHDPNDNQPKKGI